MLRKIYGTHIEVRVLQLQTECILRDWKLLEFQVCDSQQRLHSLHKQKSESFLLLQLLLLSDEFAIRTTKKIVLLQLHSDRKFLLMQEEDLCVHSEK